MTERRYKATGAARQILIALRQRQKFGMSSKSIEIHMNSYYHSGTNTIPAALRNLEKRGLVRLTTGKCRCCYYSMPMYFITDEGKAAL